MRLYIIRHAEPDYPLDALTAHGYAQARALARRLAGAGLDRIYSSPFQRALETARYTGEALGLPLEIEPWTGELEDWWIADEAKGERPAWDVDGATVRAGVPGIHQENWHAHPPFDSPPLRAGFAELQASSDAFLARHGYVRQGSSYRVVDGSGRARLAVFCHCGFGLTWLAHLLDIPLTLMWAGFTLPHCSVTTVGFEEVPGGGAAPRCSGLGDVSHLPATS